MYIILSRNIHTGIYTCMHTCILYIRTYVIHNYLCIDHYTYVEMYTYGIYTDLSKAPFSKQFEELEFLQAVFPRARPSEVVIEGSRCSVAV